MKIIYVAMMVAVLTLVGCGGGGADTDISVADAEAEASSMSVDDLKAKAMEYKSAIEAKMADIEPITAKLTHAPGNDAPIGGLKVVTENGWFAARPSGTEDIYKIYTESFKGKDHLKKIQDEAQDIVKQAFKAAGV